MHADILLEQLQAFKRRWLSKQSSTGARVLSDAALKEIVNLQVHIEKGCLSGRKKSSTDMIKIEINIMHTVSVVLQE